MSRPVPRISAGKITVRINKPCWVVWDCHGDDAPQVDGPYLCLVAVTSIEVESIPGTIVSEDIQCSRSRTGYKKWIHTEYEANVPKIGDSLDFPAMHFFLLPDNAAMWESLWVEQKYVVFSEAAAATLMEQRVIEHAALKNRIQAGAAADGQGTE